MCKKVKTLWRLIKDLTIIRIVVPLFVLVNRNGQFVVVISDATMTASNMGVVLQFL